MALNVCFRGGHVILCSYDVTVFSLFLATFRNGSKQLVPLNLINLKSIYFIKQGSFIICFTATADHQFFSCQRKLNTYNCFFGCTLKKKNIGMHLTCSLPFLKILPPGTFPNWNPSGKIFNLLPFNAWNMMPRRKRKKIQERGTHIFLSTRRTQIQNHRTALACLANFCLFSEFLARLNVTDQACHYLLA